MNKTNSSTEAIPSVRQIDADSAHDRSVKESNSALIEGTEIRETGHKAQQNLAKPTEINGPRGLEPTRYGDWESKGRCYDF